MQRVERDSQPVRVAIGAELASSRRWASGPSRTADAAGRRPAAPGASCPDTVAHPTGSPTWDQICEVLRDRVWLPEFSARLPEEDPAE